MRDRDDRKKALGGREGFTFVELLIVLAIGATLALLSFWAAAELLPKYRLESAATQLRADLFRAKMLAASTRRDVRVVFSASGYQVQTDNGAGGWNTESTHGFSDYAGVSVDTASTQSPVFHPRGTATNETMTLQNTQGATIALTTSITGRIKIQ